MEELTYDSECDSEGFSEEDSVDDELCYVSGEIPKFQFRYALEDLNINHKNLGFLVE